MRAACIALIAGCSGAASRDAEHDPCGPWLPVHQRTVQEWQTTDDNPGATGSTTYTYLGALDDEGRYGADTTSTYTSTDGEGLVFEGHAVYACDEEGVFFEHEDVRLQRDGGPWSEWSSIYLEPFLLAPRDMADGWTALARVARVDASGTTETEREFRYEVVSEETITVPAGTYDTVRVRNTLVGGESATFTHWAEGLGPVLHEANTELVTHAPR
ncbi:MAG: hypothetical protein R3F61_14240 [Myxococcota bacterium]